MKNKTTLRRKAREAVLSALYWAESTGEAAVAEPLNEMLNRFKVKGKYAQFAHDLTAIVEKNREQYTERIRELLENWDIERVSRIDRIILLMGICELDRFPDIPPRVVINEALELAKKYSSEKSFAFVNGILDAEARRMDLLSEVNKE